LNCPTFILDMKILNQHIKQVRRLCEQNGIDSLFAFGSVVTDSFRPDSDIDFIVDIDDNDPVSYSDKYFNLKFKLEEIFQRKIDLLEQKSIRNQILRNEIDRTKVLIYGKGSPSMA